jgi:uracil-DNA glycosylase
MILLANRLHKDATFTGAVPGPSRATGGTAPFMEKKGLKVLQSLGLRGKQDNPSVKITPLDVCAAFR